MRGAAVDEFERAHAGPAAVRRRLDRPDDQADGDQHQGRRPGLPRRPRSTRWSSRTTPQVAALVEAGVDILLPETVIDTLNLKACLFAIQQYFDETRPPRAGDGLGHVRQGRARRSSRASRSRRSGTPSSHFPMLSVGMNCALGPDVMRPHIEALPQVAAARISCHPNAGLPNEMGQFDLGPEPMARMVGEFAEQRLGEHRRRLLRHDAGAHRGDRPPRRAACKPHKRAQPFPAGLRLERHAAARRCGPRATS